MKTLMVAVAALLLFVFSTGDVAAAVASSGPSNSGAIHTDGDFGDGLHHEFYGSGNDDDFSEFGIAGFTFAPADFGVASLAESDIVSVQLTLTHNDRSFTDGDLVDFLFTPDTFASLGDGTKYSNLTYDASLSNGLNVGQFTTAPQSVGTLPFEGKEGPATDTFDLQFSGDQLTGLVSSINAGADFQLLITATDSTHDITFSGVENSFDPGDPVLTITTVPEPSAMVLTLLALGSLLGICRR